MQVFYRGGDNGLWTRWRNADGSWSKEEGMGGILNGDPIAAALPGQCKASINPAAASQSACSQLASQGTARQLPTKSP
jgi:hypothetical protein